MMQRTSIFRVSVFLLLVTAIFSNGYAQEKSTAVDLEMVLDMAGASNLTIQEYTQRQEIAQADLASAREWWLPDVYAGFSMHQLWGNAMNGNGVFFTEVNRQNFWAGLGFNAAWDFGQGIFKTKAAEYRIQAAEMQTQAMRNQELLDVIESYYDLLAAQLYQKAYELLALQADTVVTQMRVQVEAGLRVQSELLLARSNFNHLKVQMLTAKLSFNEASARLTRLLDLDPNIRLVATDEILAPLELDNPLIAPMDAGNSAAVAFGNRPEIFGMQYLLESVQEEKKTTTQGLFLPELRLSSYGAGFGDVFSLIRPTAAINASLMWKVPLGRVVYQGDLKGFNSRIALQEIQIEQAKAQIKEEIVLALEQLRTTKEQAVLALEGSRLAEEALQQSLDRQRLGTIRPFEILQAQEVFIQLRLDYLKSVAAYNKAQYAYFVATGNNL